MSAWSTVSLWNVRTVKERFESRQTTNLRRSAYDFLKYHIDRMEINGFNRCKPMPHIIRVSFWSSEISSKWITKIILSCKSPINLCALSAAGYKRPPFIVLFGTCIIRLRLINEQRVQNNKKYCHRKMLVEARRNCSIENTIIRKRRRRLDSSLLLLNHIHPKMNIIDSYLYYM